MRAVARFLLVCALVAGCAELGGVLKLQQELAHEFGTPQVNINLTPGQLTVLFQDAPQDSALEAKVGS